MPGMFLLLLCVVLIAPEERATFSGHSDTVNAVAVSPDGKLVASGSDDDTVRLWNPGDGKEVLRLKGHSDSVLSVAFSPSGALLASAGADDVIRIWEMPTV